MEQTDNPESGERKDPAMAQQLIDRIREAERQGDELEKRAAEEAQTRVREAGIRAAELIHRAADEAEQEGRSRLARAVQEGEAVKKGARREAAHQGCRLSSQAQERMTNGVEQAAGLLLS